MRPILIGSSAAAAPASVIVSAAAPIILCNMCCLQRLSSVSSAPLNSALWQCASNMILRGERAETLRSSICLYPQRLGERPKRLQKAFQRRPDSARQSCFVAKWTVLRRGRQKQGVPDGRRDDWIRVKFSATHLIED